MLWLEHHTKHLKIEGVKLFIYRTCLSSIEPAQMHRLDRAFDHRSVNKAYIYAEIEWVIILIPVLDNFRHFLICSRKFEVIGTRDFILKYQEFEGEKYKNI